MFEKTIATKILFSVSNQGDREIDCLSMQNYIALHIIDKMR